MKPHPRSRKPDKTYQELADLDEIDSVGKNKSRKQKHKNRLLRHDKRIICTDIPIRHFYAMLKKDIILWRRSWRRMAFEVFFPVLIFVVISIIRIKIPIKQQDQTQNLTRYMVPLSPLPTPTMAGISWWKDENETVSSEYALTVKDYQIIMSNVIAYQESEDWLDFHGFNIWEKQASNPWGKWLADTCQETMFNKARSKFGIVGDVVNSQMTREIMRDVRDYFDFKRRFKTSTFTWYQYFGAKLRDQGDLKSQGNPFEDLGGIQALIDPDPIVFKTESQFLEYINHPDYEVAEDRPGMCLAIVVDENISDPKTLAKDQRVKIDMWVEAQRGRTRASGSMDATAQSVIPSTSMPSFDRYSKNPNAYAAEMYVRQGYSWVHNWAANAALRQLTKNPKARIDLSVAPFKQDKTIKDDFEEVLKGIYSYIALIIYILPMYTYILRMQIEKQQGMKRHLSIIGLSFKAQYLAEFVSYTMHMSLITIGITLTMYYGGLFPMSFSNSKLLMFLFTWVQGVSNFGFIVMIVNLLPHNMYPKLAAKWGSLIYFSSSFVDFTIQKIGIPESIKIYMSMAFPTLAVARASRNLAIFEYTPGGTGLNYDETLFEPYHHFRIITYFFVMAWALIVHFSIGMLFEKYGSFPEIVRSIFKFLRGQERDQWHKDGDPTRKALKPIDPLNFEAEGQKLGYKLDEEALEQEETLNITNLIKRFKTPGDPKHHLTAVDNLNLELNAGEIFALLGHNGAGKTTTISMLTGMLESTSGIVQCYGKQMIGDQPNLADQEYIKQIMGICPQHDILFDTLTVTEHLDVFCDFKGVPEHLKSLKINQIMKDVGVYPHRDTMAKDLSGGNRRKLSVALSLVADSKLVLLDEPTSGMDLNARRRLWNMLKDYKQDRIIILTTHNMDEADLLGDRVGIMSQGRLVCLGSPTFLKSRYGCGYKLQVKKSVPGSSSLPLKLFLDRNLGEGIQLLQDDGYQCVMQIPKQHSQKFPRFFDELDQQNIQVNLGIKTYSVSVSSLEEVFLRVGEEQEPDSEQVISQELTITEEQNREINKYRREREDKRVLLSQVFAVFKRKLMFHRRNLKETLFEMLVPAILVIIGLSLTCLDFKEAVYPRTLTPDNYHWKQRILVNENLVKLGTKESEDDDFDDEDVFKGQVDISPRTFVELMPNYQDGAWQVEFYDPVPEVEKDYIINMAERQKGYEVELQKAQQEYDEAFEKVMLEYQKNIEKNQKKALNEFQMRANNSWVGELPGQEYVRNNPYDVKKRHVQPPEEYDRSGKAMFKKFQEQIEKTAAFNQSLHSLNEETVFKYRYGSYYFYEANNKTKTFRVATCVNTTSQDVVALYPQFMYEAILKVATGNKDFKFQVTSMPFPITEKQRDRVEEASGIFVCFVVGIAFSLIPASIVSRMVAEKEKGLYHIQIVSGVEKVAYYGAFMMFDLIIAYVPCFITIWAFDYFKLEYWMVWKTVLLYPLAAVPFSYTTSFIFDKESTAQTFTIYLNFLLSGIACMIVFALRMVEATCFWGDNVMWVLRFICPTFSVCNSIIYGGCATILSRQRDQIRYELYEHHHVEQIYLPNQIFARNPYHPDNLLGDWIGLATIMVMHWFIFVRCENLSWNKVEQWAEGTWFSKHFVFKYPEPKSVQQLELDEDVIQEENRVQNCSASSVCVNKFRKIYSVPFSKPILAVERASFAVNEGECFALLGINGAGKSTTFKSLTNVVEPTSGQISILNANISKDFNVIRYRIGYCPQQQALFNGLTVKEHLEFYANLKGLPDDILQNHMHKFAENLSGGNKRKLQTAIAILGNPLIILLDEPSAGMDPAARKFMWKVVSNITLERPKSCVILTTHSMEEADALSTRMGIMVHGGIFKCMGTSQHIKDKFGSGYEIELKLNQLLEQEAEQEIKRAGLSRDQDFALSEIAKRILLPHDAGAFIKQCLVMMFNHNAEQYEPHQVIVSSQQFFSYLHAYKSLREIIRAFENRFKEVEILESYGKEYFKIRIPRDNKTLGYMYGFVEANKKPSWSLKEYSISQTTLEMIFHKFAQGDADKRRFQEEANVATEDN